jgi:hypothetical protein
MIKLAATVAVSMALASCTAPMVPTDCGRQAFRCGAVSDVKFCESVALDVEGSDCTSLGVEPSKPFCYATRARCVHADYAVKGRDCKVLRYQPVREWSECSLGTPTFIEP